MKKGMKYLAGIIVAGLVLYNSVYVQRLDERLAENQELDFDAQLYVESIWSSDLQTAYDSALDLIDLLDQLSQEPDRMFEEEAQALGIGNVGFFKVKGEGTIIKINENDIWIQLGDRTLEIETEFIFGNAIRDASGLVQLNDYDKTSDFNSISEAINEKIRKEIIPTVRERASVGDKLTFKGALELNKAHLNLSQPEIIPISLLLHS